MSISACHNSNHWALAMAQDPESKPSNTPKPQVSSRPADSIADPPLVLNLRTLAIYLREHAGKLPEKPFVVDLKEIPYDRRFSQAIYDMPVESVRVPAEWEERATVVYSRDGREVQGALRQGLAHWPGDLVMFPADQPRERWIRDSFPFTVLVKEKTEAKYPVRFAELWLVPKQVPEWLMKKYHRFLFQSPEEIRLPMRLQGGMLQSDGAGHYMITEGFFDDFKTEAEMDTWNIIRRRFSLLQSVAAFRTFLGCEKLYVLQSGLDYSRHVDTIARFMPPKVNGGRVQVLLARPAPQEYAAGVRHRDLRLRWRDRMQANLDFFRGLDSQQGAFDIHTVDTGGYVTWEQDKPEKKILAFIPFTNSYLLPAPTDLVGRETARKLLFPVISSPIGGTDLGIDYEADKVYLAGLIAAARQVYRDMGVTEFIDTDVFYGTLLGGGPHCQINEIFRTKY